MNNNDQKFLDMLKVADPELWALKQALLITNINPLIIAETIRAISKIVNGSGLGKVEIYLTNNAVRNINTQERNDLYARDKDEA